MIVQRGLSTTTTTFSKHIGVRPSKKCRGMIFPLEEAIEKAKNSVDVPNAFYEIDFKLNIDRKLPGQNLEGKPFLQSVFLTLDDVVVSRSLICCTNRFPCSVTTSFGPRRNVQTSSRGWETRLEPCRFDDG
jgi:hypothetical protein